MVVISLPPDKRLKSKRVVKQLAKDVRASIRSPRWCDVNHSFWLTLEKSQEDEIYRICTRKLLITRLEIKKILRNLSDGECSVEDLISKTCLNKDFVLSILQKHGYGNEQEDCGNCSIHSAVDRPKKGNNITSDVPVLDISSVRKDKLSSEISNNLQPLADEVNENSDGRTPIHSLVEEGKTFVKNSLREVTDSSAEISDLAKRISAHFFRDSTSVDQLRNIKRGKSFVQQLHEIVTSSSSTQTTVKHFHFIPSIPISTPSLPCSIPYKEADVQTSTTYETPAVAVKEMRDNATDLPSFDYFCKSELSGLQQLPEAFVFHEDLSSSAFSSDKSAGQVSDSLKSRIRTTISIARDGSAQFVPCETVKLSEFIEKSLKSAFTCNSSTPHVSGSLWRPSSRRLRLEEVDISTSEDSNSLEVVSVGMAKRCAYNQADSRSMTRVWDSAKTEFSTGLDGSDSELLAKESSDSSHQDDDHTYNQVSQITSE